MLIYDEWVVPGEVKYAERKAAEIEAQIQEYYKDFQEDKWGSYGDSIYIQITEHVIGEFNITLLNSLWVLPDIDVYNDMKIDWFRDKIAPIDAPKIFDLPADDIRSSLPEWDESLLPDSASRDILRMHSILYKVLCWIKNMDGDYYLIQREFNLSDAKCSRIMETFIDKLNRLDTENKLVTFTELEEEIGKYMVSNDRYGFWHDYYYEPWYFPLTMSERDIIEAIHEAYMNASKRSRRIIPDKFDNINMGRGCGAKSEFTGTENYECLYQGKAEDLLIRFLFDFKNMRIVMAYPVLKEKRESAPWGERYYYNKASKRFTYTTAIDWKRREYL